MNAEIDISKISGDQQGDWPLGKNPGYRNGGFKYLRLRLEMKLSNHGLVSLGLTILLKRNICLFHFQTFS